MSDYKRFISYIYEYIDQKKAANRGFVKVEIRSGVCRLQFQIKVFSLPQQTTVRVYGYRHQKDALTGQLLGELHAARSGIYECITSPAATPAFDGLILIDASQGRFFATQWDDVAIVPSQFQAVKTDTTEPETLNSWTATDPESSASQVTADPDLPFTHTATGAEIPVARAITGPESGSEPEMTTMAADTPDVTIADLNAAEKKQSSCIWKQLLQKYPHVHPFDDDEIFDCMQIKMQDLPSLRGMGFQLSCNQFLCQSFQCHRHLLLGCIQTDAKPYCILGVPGIYNEQERFFAQLYGFCRFKQAHMDNLDGKCKRGGYWYRPLSCCSRSRLFDV